MNTKLLMDTAVLAGKTMLKYGAETHRVEDTVSRILKISGFESVEVLVLKTGLMVTLDDPSVDASTVVLRVDSKRTNLNRICQVNEVSRKLCAAELTLEEAYRELKTVHRPPYPMFLRYGANIFVAGGSTLLLGGSVLDSITAGFVSLLLILSLLLTKKINIHTFLSTVLACSAVAAGAMLLSAIPGFGINQDLVIIGCIMPLAPGVAITNALRDTLYGDYLSGGARTLEAFVTAAGMAVGVGVGVSVVSWMMGGLVF